MEVLPTSFYLSVLILCSEELCSYSEIRHCIRTLWIAILSRMLFSRREAPCILEELNKNGYKGSHQGNQNTTSDSNWAAENRTEQNREQQQSRRLCNYIFPSINFQFQQSALTSWVRACVFTSDHIWRLALTWICPAMFWAHLSFWHPQDHGAMDTPVKWYCMTKVLNFVHFRTSSLVFPSSY